MDLYFGSLLPPDLDEGADADPPKSCLLDRKPFIGKRTNATTATCRIQDDVAIQVSFFAAHPPCMSYILAWSSRTCFTDEPVVLSTDGGLILLSFAIQTERFPFSAYYIYQPSAPSLHLIPQPSGRRLVDDHCRAALLSHGRGSSGYHVVTLTMEAEGEFHLYVFSSDTQIWTLKKPVLILEDGAPKLANYMTYKAIPLGGGSMAFVDFWNGILICNVLDGGESPELHYLPLPSTGLCQPSPSCYPLSPRDITLNVDVQGKGETMDIKLAEVVYPFNSEGWCTDTWVATTMAISPWRKLKGWHKESTHGSELSLPEGLNLAGLLDLNTLGCLFVDMPMLSLDQDNVVCFMAKNDIDDYQAWLIAVDMAKKKLQGVSLLEVERSPSLFYSSISDHLIMTAPAKYH
jgi:hypothetical protein